MKRYLLMSSLLALLAVFVFVLVIFVIALNRDPSEVPSPLIGKKAPDFELPRLQKPEQTLSLTDLKGNVSLLNVWASWCQSCRMEHPMLLNIARSGAVDIYGLNYKDKRDAAIRWLSELGNPYTAIAFDHSGRIGIDFGVYGAPESYLLDRNGTIVYKKVGPITPDVWQNEIQPLVQKLNEQP